MLHFLVYPHDFEETLQHITHQHNVEVTHHSHITIMKKQTVKCDDLIEIQPCCFKISVGYVGITGESE